MGSWQPSRVRTARRLTGGDMFAAVVVLALVAVAYHIAKVEIPDTVDMEIIRQAAQERAVREYGP